MSCFLASSIVWGQFWNVGTLPKEIKINELKKSHSSYPRNELLADVFFKAGLIEAWGRGTIKITDECKKAELPGPEFKEEFGGFTVYFYKDIYTDENLMKLGLNARQIIAIKFVKEHKQIDLSSFKALATGVSEKTLYRDLQVLVNRGLLKEIGEKKGRKYELP